MTAAPAPTRRAVLCGAAGCLALTACERAREVPPAASSGPPRVLDSASNAPSDGRSPAQPSASPSAVGSTHAAPIATSAQARAGTPLPVSLPDGGPAFLTRTADGFVLLDGTCTHAACAVTWQAAGRVFLCPCHLSRFDPAGRVLTPPATQALPRIPLVERDGSIYLA
jgi:Rieske Fe-S protein